MVLRMMGFCCAVAESLLQNLNAGPILARESVGGEHTAETADRTAQTG